MFHEGVAPLFLNLITLWRWVGSVMLWPLSSQERAPSTNWIAGCFVPEASLDILENINLLPQLEFKPQIVHPVA